MITLEVMTANQSETTTPVSPPTSTPNPPPAPSPPPVPEPTTPVEPQATTAVSVAASTASLPILHPLTTIPENRSNTLAAHATTPNNNNNHHHYRRAYTLRYPIPYPDTPYSATGLHSLPYTPRSRGNSGSATGSSSFFVWPGGLPRPGSTSKRNNTSSSNRGILPTTNTTTSTATDKPAGQAQKVAAPTVTAASPADTTVTREFEHEVRLLEKRREAEFPRRLLTALVGGVAVIVPMVIMSLGRSLVKSLVTSSVAVLTFGVALAWTSAADEASLMVATAGYAAVLAVFVALGDGN